MPNPKRFPSIVRALATGAFLLPSLVIAAGFQIAGSTVKDANGNPFIARGVSNPHIWFDSQAYNVLPDVAARRTNLIRVVWTTAGTASRLDQILTAIEAQKMVSMVELHDGTGSNDATLLASLGAYWARSDVAAVLKKHERYLMINIANEWSNSSKTPAQWDIDYKKPIATIRAAGLTTTIVIDNPAYAQNANGGLQYGQDLLNADPQHNLLFSIHMYAQWGNPQDVYNAMANYKKANLPLVIGEFGYDYQNGNNNLGCTVNADLLMQYAQQFGIGYVAWSTQGNDTADAWLDLMTDWSGTTAWGNEVWYSQYGIYNTAKTASVFAGTGSPIAAGTYKIINKNSGLALDAYGWGTTDGTTIDQYGYGGGNNQRWTLNYLGGGQYTIVNVNANKALDVTASGGSGTWVQLWDTNAGANQTWTITATGGGYYRLTPSYNANLALDVYGASGGNYAAGSSNGRIDAYTWSGNANQQWAFQTP